MRKVSWMNKEEKIEIMKEKVEEIVKQKISENFSDAKQINAKVVTKEIIKELEKVMKDEDQ